MQTNDAGTTGRDAEKKSRDGRTDARRSTIDNGDEHAVMACKAFELGAGENGGSGNATEKEITKERRHRRDEQEKHRLSMRRLTLASAPVQKAP